MLPYLQEMDEYHHMKAKSVGKPVFMLPLVLFSDVTSGNKSKKWDKFISWYLKLVCLNKQLPKYPKYTLFAVRQASETTNHLCGAAKKYCCICEVQRMMISCE